MNKTEIYDLKAYLVEDLYKGVRGEQKADEAFYRDAFDVPQLISPSRVQRTGRASRLVDAPTEHIITSNPQAFRESKKDNATAEASALAVSTELNRWLTIMRRANPNPFKQTVKNDLLRGELWIHPIHNERWVTGKKVRNGLPVLFTTPDPMVIYADPTEDENGIPEQVIVWYPRRPSIIKSLYPNWSNPEGKDLTDAKVTVDWLEYWDKDQCYFDADGQILHNGKNLYGVTPFVHALSGFGTTSAEGNMEDLIVGRLRKSRDRLRRECAIVSDIDSTFHLFANRNIDVQPNTAQDEVPSDFADKYVMGKGLIHELPYGITVSRSEELLPEPQLFQYYRDIVAEFELEDPLVISGSPMGGSGRQQDLIQTSAMRRYDTIVESVEYAWATALGIGLQICEKIPTLCPEEYGMKKTDIGKYYEVKIQLKADDPIESDRKATLGSRLYQQGEIDLETNLIKYQGYTLGEAKKILAKILVDNATRNNPIVAEIMGRQLALEAGMDEQYEALKTEAGRVEGNLPGIPQTGSQGGQAREGNVKTARGRSEADVSLTQGGARRPPGA